VGLNEATIETTADRKDVLAVVDPRPTLVPHCEIARVARACEALIHAT
jgi:hypothetical protein